MQEISRLRLIIDEYFKDLKELKEHCERCLRTERWGGSVVLMIIDAAFTSIGLNYFTAVVPKVMEFKERFIKTGVIESLEDYTRVDIVELKKVWKNERSLLMGKEIAAFFIELKKRCNFRNDKEDFRSWAKKAKIETWEKDPVGKIKGVGINTFQYLRMMGGVDTVMPDKIVKRVILRILEDAGMKIKIETDIEFVKFVHKIALITGYRPIELCWMTWLIQKEGRLMRMEKYRKVLREI